MEDLLKKMQHMKRHGSYDAPHAQKKLKRIILIVAVLGTLFAVMIITLIIALIVWIFNQGGDAAQKLPSQTQSLTSSLNLETYVANGVVDTQRLKEVYESLPSPLQAPWLSEFRSQLDELRQQAQLPADVLQSLTALYESLTPN